MTSSEEEQGRISPSGSSFSQSIASSPPQDIEEDMEEISSTHIGISADDETRRAHIEAVHLSQQEYYRSAGATLDDGFGDDDLGVNYSAYSYIDEEEEDDDDSDDDDFDDSDAEKEWNENIEQLQQLFNYALIPLVGKYLGRKCAYWGNSSIPLCPILFHKHITNLRQQAGINLCNGSILSKFMSGLNTQKQLV